mmetsp:Transcript_2641/g.4825  ORF Transcript_2641/g.4825 Transcript_2641/m.4825 type:complete len:214 (+) Transcript_2641:183-824(+)
MPDVADNRDYPGMRPFAEPGQSVSNVGPCGQENYGNMVNWNQPHDNWGFNTVATYNAGDVIDVEWCVSDAADHGGVYSYRICQDDNIVSKFIDPNYMPNEGDWADMEACFQAGILKCSDVDGNNCYVHPDCGGTGWGCEYSSQEWFNCGPVDGGRCMSTSTGETCNVHGGTGAILRDKVKLPMYTSNHTLMGFRWDCEDTTQLWVHCADIAIV